MRIRLAPDLQGPADAVAAEPGAGEGVVPANDFLAVVYLECALKFEFCDNNHIINGSA